MNEAELPVDTGFSGPSGPSAPEPGARSDARPNRRRMVLTWLICAAIVVPFGLWMSRLGPTPNSDDWAQYLMHAEAIAEGRDYTDISYVFSHYAWGTGPPIGAPGLPLTMAPVVGLFGFQSWMHAGFNMAALLVLMTLVMRYFGRNNPTRAATAAVLTGVALILVRGVDTLQPDMAFAALIWGALLLADSVEDWSWARALGIGLLGLWAILFRVAALPLVPAMAVFGVLTWKTHKKQPFWITALWIFATAYLFMVVEAGRIPPPEPWIEIPPSLDTGPSLLTLITDNLVRYRLSLFELQTYPFTSGILNDVYHLLATPLVILGLLVWLEGSWFRLGAIFAAAYAGMLLVAPFAADRYLWPLWPLAAYALVTGLDVVLDRIPLGKVPKRGARSAIAVGAVVAIAMFTGLTRDLEPTIYAQDNVEEVVDFIGAIPAEAEPTAVFYLPRSFSWTTGVPTMSLFSAPSNEAVLREMEEKRATHVVLGILGSPDHLAALERWTATIQSYPERFALVMENADFSVYEIQEPRGRRGGPR